METKQCPVCNDAKSVTEFNAKGYKADGSRKYQWCCRTCNKLYQKQHYASNKETYYIKNKTQRQSKKQWLRNYLSDKKCTECGEDHPATLDFHHLSTDDKLSGVYDMTHNCNSITMIQEEISKCVIVCSNCHRKIHYNLRVPSANG